MVGRREGIEIRRRKKSKSQKRADKQYEEEEHDDNDDDTPRHLLFLITHGSGFGWCSEQADMKLQQEPRSCPYGNV